MKDELVIDGAVFAISHNGFNGFVGVLLMDLDQDNRMEQKFFFLKYHLRSKREKSL